MNRGRRGTLISLLTLSLMLGLLAATAGPANAGKPGGVTIQDGVLVDSAGDPIVLGFNGWGYNYQAHLFEGGYCDAYRNAAWCQPYRDDQLAMKWNDAWLSNMDRDGAGLLDRHYGLPGYIGSGAWLTNHMSGLNADGTRWTYFVKIVAAPADATLVAGVWLAADGSELGPVIWGEFAIIQEVINDPSDGSHGIAYLSPTCAGFGRFGPH